MVKGRAVAIVLDDADMAPRFTLWQKATICALEGVKIDIPCSNLNIRNSGIDPPTRFEFI
jgi:hypothetical protein